MASKPLVNVDIVSDVMCPWCFVGKRKLEGAIKQLNDKLEIQVRWLPFLLRPDMPPEGKPKENRYKNPAWADRMRQAGQEVGIEFTNFKNTHFPNTLLAHALLDLAHKTDGGVRQNDVAERIFKAYYEDCQMLTEDDVVRVGQDAGFDAAQVRSYITDQGNLTAVRNAAINNSKEANGVPLFYFNGQRMFSGAQSEETFVHTLTMAAEEIPVASKV